MTDFKQKPEIADNLVPASNAVLEQRVSQLEKALLEYVERYGLTDTAREAFRDPKR